MPAGREARHRAVRLGGCSSAHVEHRADGAVLLRSTEPLQPWRSRLTDCLEHWAHHRPGRVFAAQRSLQRGRPWRPLRYAEAFSRVLSVAEALARRGLSAERPVMVLSGNDLDHLVLGLACQWVGVPHVPVSPAYSLLSRDFAKLREVMAVATPGLVFAAGAQYRDAIDAVVPADAEVVLGDGALEGRASTPFERLLHTPPGAAAEAAHAQVGPDTIAKLLFTSGSTKEPKAVINTQRMLCANQQMLRQVFAFVADEPPVLVDWLPWHHTFGGNHNLGLVLYNGGTLYIDEGKPTPQAIGETLRNLREVAPTIYFNVPRGFEQIVGVLEHDPLLRETLFGRVRAFMYAGAVLSQAVWDQLDDLAERTIGCRVRMLTGLGMTETAPACTFALQEDVRSCDIGLPAPGVEVKLAPLPSGRMEIRFRGPHVTPGYWRAPEATARAFDDEGFYRTGDAVGWRDAADPQRGLRFEGRIAEDFKLSSGTFVSVGLLRARVLAEGSPWVQDAVVTAPERAELGLLIVPRLDECRRLAGLGLQAGADEVLQHAAVRERFQRLVDRLWALGTGSASRIARAHVLAETLSIDAGEITDKGSVNQRVVLQRRAALVQALYDAGPDTGFAILPRKQDDLPGDTP